MRIYFAKTRRCTTTLRQLLDLSPDVEVGDLKIHDRALRTLYRERLDQERAHVRVDSHMKKIGVQIPRHGPSIGLMSLKIRK